MLAEVTVGLLPSSQKSSTFRKTNLVRQTCLALAARAQFSLSPLSRWKIKLTNTQANQNQLLFRHQRLTTRSRHQLTLRSHLKSFSKTQRHKQMEPKNFKLKRKQKQQNSVMPRQVACKITKKSVLKLSLCQNQNFHRKLQKNSEYRQLQCQLQTNHKLACLFISRIVAQCPTSSHRCNQQKLFQCLKWIQTLYELNYSLKVSLLNRKSNSL